MTKQEQMRKSLKDLLERTEIEIAYYGSRNKYADAKEVEMELKRLQREDAPNSY